MKVGGQGGMAWSASPGTSDGWVDDNYGDDKIAGAKSKN